MFKKINLENGLRILTAPMTGTNTVTVFVFCNTGSDNEEKRQNGISHFLEHMFFKGTTKRPSAKDLREEIDGKGAASNAFTSHEVTGYFIKCGAPYASWAVELLSDIYQNSVFDIGEIDRERQVVVEEMHMRNDDPTSRVFYLWEEHLYGDQPAGWNVMGPEAVIRSLSRDEFASYFHHQYVSENTAIIIAGNFDEGKIISEIRELFGSIRGGSPRARPDVSFHQTEPRLTVEKRVIDQTNLIVGFPAFPATHPKRHASELLASVLGDGWSSRMFSRVREELGLAYHVSSFASEFTNRGYLATYAGVAHENAGRAMEAILEEYRRIREEPVSASELARTKEYIRGHMLMSLERSDAVANFIGEEEMLTGRPLTIEEVFARLDAVTADDIQSVARELFKPDQLNAVVLGADPDRTNLEGIVQRYT